MPEPTPTPERPVSRRRFLVLGGTGMIAAAAMTTGCGGSGQRVTVREPDRDMPHFPLGLTMGMMLSVPLVLAGLGLILYSRRPASLAPPAQTSPADAPHDESRAEA